MDGGACGGVPALELLKLRAAERIDEAAERLGALSRAIWSEPELAYEEHRAHDVLTRFFEREPPAASWTVQPHYQLATAFRAEWEPPGGRATPRPLQLGFLCEYDALPGLGHACGHNLIAEVGAAAALGVKGALEGRPGPPPPVKVRWGPGSGPAPPALPERSRPLGVPARPGRGGGAPGYESAARELPARRRLTDFGFLLRSCQRLSRLSQGEELRTEPGFRCDLFLVTEATAIRRQGCAISGRKSSW